MKKLSVIILNYNTSDMTHRCVDALLSSEGITDLEVIVVDNASHESLKNFDDSRITLVRNSENLGFAKGVNVGLKQASGEYVLLLNSDVILESKTLQELVEYLDNNTDCGLIGPAFSYPNKKFQPSAGSFPSFWGEFLRFSTLWKFISSGTLKSRTPFNSAYFQKAQSVDWLSGGCLLVRSDVFEVIGQLDEAFFFGVEDFDFCFRAKAAGWKVIYYPLVSVIHYHGFSSGGRRSTSSLKREAQGMDYFLEKNMPQKKLLRSFISLLYFKKIFLLNILFSKLKSNESLTRK